MKIIEIQELIDFITKSGLEEVNIETENIKLHVKRSMAPAQQVTLAAPNTFPSTPPVHLPLSAPVSTATASTSIENLISANYITVQSPMIGTFYRSPSPDAAPFVKIGDAIAKGTKLCIIEAMKLYNEIEAEVTGKIVEILVDDVSPVEYDQPLFLVDPS
jgi:acetyl-CoA carboxylase biotin carboxyl carrier protein